MYEQRSSLKTQVGRKTPANPDAFLGMKTVWVKNGLAQYQGAELGEGIADYQIGSLSELLHILSLCPR